MNFLLTQALAALPGSITDDLILFDAYAGLNAIVANRRPMVWRMPAPPVPPTGLAMPARPSSGMASTRPAGHQVMARLAVAAIPEPATGLLLGLAFLGLAATRRRAA
jgi:hypothetical protein